jgi:DHA1 family bicyclomycin/chloramphenicol resistance-like MFS transporter
LKYAVTGLLICSILTGTSLLLNASIGWFCATLFLTLICAGATFPVTTNLALDLEHQYKGTASAVLGASTFLVGGIVMPLVGLGNTLHSTAYVMTASAVITMILLCAVNKCMNLLRGICKKKAPNMSAFK